MNLFDFTLKIKGFPLAAAREHLQQTQSIPAKDKGDYQREQALKIANYHLKNTAFYRDLVGRETITDFSELPLLTKADLQQPLADRLSEEYTTGKVYVNKTSGSSGHPFIFAKDKFAHALTWAFIMQQFGQYNLDFNRSYQARFYGIPLKFPGYQKERLKDLLSQRYRFPIFDLQEKELEKILKQFKNRKFEYINGYTSSIVLFAKFLRDKGLVLTEVCPSLRLCLVTSEMLFESDRMLLETHLGVPVINEYGASELDLIAFTAPDGSFAINTDNLFVEVVDDAGSPVHMGSPGRLIITSLYNKAHPFIRYDIGDLGIIDEDEKGKPYLKELIGRTNDIAHLPSGKTVPGLTFYYVTKSVIEDSGKVKEFVVIQKEIDRFLVRYVSDQALTETETATMEKALETYLETGLHLDFEHCQTIVRSARGKLKQFSSEYHG
ncbi:phenylacetate--CoA ligase family protein [Gilvibacter sediminis]|uniref:phenylacetate--CoA ligase family protein n=1 Tax=Gilvibacter sediminis TaxID=379071 RepID=UPI002350D8D5|nr:phenylacetate--CoA ligase family protein [Gilvibacter sediminis]MDC7996777.1 phenylacetate--CoA ligase family protein [Gilvibacter sediminis]